MQLSDMMMAVTAAMLLVFPTRRAVFHEARPRVRATFYGAAMALPILALITLAPHFLILLGLGLLCRPWLHSIDIERAASDNAQQYALSIA